MLIKGLIVLIFVAYAYAEYVPTFDCQNITSAPQSKDVLLQVSDCHATDERCPLYQGRTHSVIVKFKPLKTYSGKIDFRVYGVFEKFSVPYRGRADAYENAHYTDNGEAVSAVGSMIENREIKHTSDFAVSKNYPKVSLKVRFVIIERRTKEMIMCRELPVEIKADPEDSS
ncbi:hypothetical protein JTE90_023627 [Oedothorax gibbosus]|uniref:MD-2-related lipid-recognition domain-containing protein n=1 Tax=Oedothorax gibbosus TaxID=931172 RepID=A0AAV6U6A3_9ARAC|nr:hypothetical protein JTE90_023627 [Oedothorax gibbosus]